jgi:CDGSH-type Zn-finger protein
LTAERKENKNKTPSDNCAIKVSKNGPYIVSGRIPIATQTINTDAEGVPNEWHAGNEYPLQENCTLCRCGQSKNKPFCDGTHIKVKFDGAETASKKPYIDQAKEISGPALKLTDAEDLCASARFCHRAGGIWMLTPQSDNPKAKKIVIEEAGDCPSGRLVVWDKKTGKALEPELKRSIGLVEDPQAGVSGPIWVRGCIPIKSADGKTYEVRNRVTLCRCGKSSNKPFCDSSHYPE